MTRKLIDFCPPVDALTLLQFRSDTFRAWCAAPDHQSQWRVEYRLISELLCETRYGPVRLMTPGESKAARGVGDGVVPKRFQNRL